MARTNENGATYAPWEKPPDPTTTTTTGTGTGNPPGFVPPALQSGTKPKPKGPFVPAPWIPAPVIGGPVAPPVNPPTSNPQPQTWSAPWNPDPTNPFGQVAGNPLGGPPPTTTAPAPLTEQQQENNRRKSWVKPSTKRANGPTIYNFAGGQAAPGGTFNPTSIPGMPTFLQNPGMPPAPTLPAPAPADSGGGNTWWGGGGGGGGYGGGGGGSRGRGAWAQSLYSLNVNR